MSDRISDLLDRARELTKDVRASKLDVSVESRELLVALALLLDTSTDLIEELEQLLLTVRPVLWVTQRDHAAAIAWERAMAELLELKAGAA